MQRRERTLELAGTKIRGDVKVSHSIHLLECKSCLRTIICLLFVPNVLAEFEFSRVLAEISGKISSK